MQEIDLDAARRYRVLLATNQNDSAGAVSALRLSGLSGAIVEIES
jgi:hypothetical protein